MSNNNKFMKIMLDLRVVVVQVEKKYSGHVYASRPRESSRLSLAATKAVGEETHTQEQCDVGVTLLHILASDLSNINLHFHHQVKLRESSFQHISSHYLFHLSIGANT